MKTLPLSACLLTVLLPVSFSQKSVATEIPSPVINKTSFSRRPPLALKIEKAKQWKLIWSDEFNTPGTPDPKKWEFELGGGGFGNYELEHYTDRAKNARVEDGYLVIEAHKEDFEEDHYTSARMHIKNARFKYGRVEVRAKMPSGAGVWPAIWMLADKQNYGKGLWPDNGEIDIAEYVGRDPNKVLSCYYTKSFNWMDGTGKTSTADVLNAETEFHIYGLEWDKDQMTISVDNNKYHTFKNPHTNWKDWPYDKPFMFILNLALGGYGGDMDDTVLPQKMLVDYVRIYQKR